MVLGFYFFSGYFVVTVFIFFSFFLIKGFQILLRLHIIPPLLLQIERKEGKEKKFEGKKAKTLPKVPTLCPVSIGDLLEVYILEFPEFINSPYSPPPPPREGDTSAHASLSTPWSSGSVERGSSALRTYFPHHK